MDVDYKGHHIVALAWHNPDGWKPHLDIAWSESDKTPITHRPFTIKKRYATEKEAQEAGLAYAKKWIDEGKPDPAVQVDAD
jgi:hypothetical protein